MPLLIMITTAKLHVRAHAICIDHEMSIKLEPLKTLLKPLSQSAMRERISPAYVIARQFQGERSRGLQSLQRGKI